MSELPRPGPDTAADWDRPGPREPGPVRVLDFASPWPW